MISRNSAERERKREKYTQREREVSGLSDCCVSTLITLQPYREASPGKLGSLEDELFRNTDMNDAPIVVAVTVTYVDAHRMVGVAFCNATRRSAALSL